MWGSTKKLGQIGLAQVYWIQTNKQTDTQTQSIYKDQHRKKLRKCQNHHICDKIIIYATKGKVNFRSELNLSLMTLAFKLVRKSFNKCRTLHVKNQCLLILRIFYQQEIKLDI